LWLTNPGSGELLSRLPAHQLTKKSRGCLANGRSGSGASSSTRSHCHIERRAALFIPDVQLRAIPGQQLDDRIGGERGEMQRGLAGLVNRVDVDVPVEEHLDGFEHSG